MTPRNGFALIEVIVALALVASAGLALVDVVSEAARVEDRAARRETRVRDEDRLLRAYTLLTARDLTARVGLNHTGPYVVRVQRDGWDMFDVSVSERGGDPDLSTSLYRPSDNDGR